MISKSAFAYFMHRFTFIFYFSKEFQLAMDYKKNNCSRSYESASPGADETTARCCARISVNHCYEKQYGLKFHILLEPIIDESCREHLKDTLAMCNIDTR